MDTFLDNIAVGDTVFIECFTSIGTDSSSKVTDIRTKYDEDTGEPYRVICFEDHEFDGRSGLAITPPTMYYLWSGE